MNQKTLIKKLSLIAPILLIVVFAAVNNFAQIDEVLIVKQKARTTIKPKAKPAPKNIDIVRTVSITRIAKKSRKNYRKPVAARKKSD